MGCTAAKCSLQHPTLQPLRGGFQNCFIIELYFIIIKGPKGKMQSPQLWKSQRLTLLDHCMTVSIFSVGSVQTLQKASKGCVSGAVANNQNKCATRVFSVPSPGIFFCHKLKQTKRNMRQKCNQNSDHSFRIHCRKPYDTKQTQTLMARVAMWKLSYCASESLHFSVFGSAASASRSVLPPKSRSNQQQTQRFPMFSRFRPGG